MQNKHGDHKHISLNQETVGKTDIFPTVSMLYYFLIVFRGDGARDYPYELGCYGFSLGDLMVPTVTHPEQIRHWVD